jgi:hypothetical protein
MPTPVEARLTFRYGSTPVLGVELLRHG